MHARDTRTHLLASPFCEGFLPLMRLARAISLITDILISHCASVSPNSCQQVIWLPYHGILWAFKSDNANSVSAPNTCPFLPPTHPPKHNHNDEHRRRKEKIWKGCDTTRLLTSYFLLHITGDSYFDSGWSPNLLPILCVNLPRLP